MSRKKKPDDYPVLYVIVRNDLSSMSTGKQEAHSGHAASAFHHNMTYLVEQGELDNEFVEWSSSTSQGFGTQINLDAGIDDIHAIYNICKQEGIICDLIVDPTYPFMPDIKLNAHLFGFGAMTRNEITAMYVFGRKNDIRIKALLDGLRLK